MERLPSPIDTETGLPFVPQEFFEYEDDNRDRHHLFYPRALYLGQSAVHSAFRTLHIVEMPRAGHVAYHTTFEPPEMPSIDFMIGYVQASGMHVSRRLLKDLRRFA